ncbi:hypothetical protein VLK31_34640 [Variovorax sp. H27-G14]|uniref:hypothetical protein n=1 Tax=Variovorax sp. H27-G14 TaxID=3111914 RepID=UPI0038FD2718
MGPKRTTALDVRNRDRYLEKKSGLALADVIQKAVGDRHTCASKAVARAQGYRLMLALRLDRLECLAQLLRARMSSEPKWVLPHAAFGPTIDTASFRLLLISAPLKLTTAFWEKGTPFSEASGLIKDLFAGLSIFNKQLN